MRHLAWEKPRDHLCRVLLRGDEVTHQVRHPGHRSVRVDSFVEAELRFERVPPVGRLPGFCPVIERLCLDSHCVEHDALEVCVPELRGNLQCALRAGSSLGHLLRRRSAPSPKPERKEGVGREKPSD